MLKVRQRSLGDCGSGWCSGWAIPWPTQGCIWRGRGHVKALHSPEKQDWPYLISNGFLGNAENEPDNEQLCVWLWTCVMLRNRCLSFFLETHVPEHLWCRSPFGFLLTYFQYLFLSLTSVSVSQDLVLEPLLWFFGAPEVISASM